MEPKKRITAVALVIFVFVLSAFLIVGWSKRSQHKNQQSSAAPQGTSVPDLGRSLSDPSIAVPLVSETPDFAATRNLDKALISLKSAGSAEDSRMILADLRAYLVSLPPDLAAVVIGDFLANPTNNAATRIEFSIGERGFLTGQPSLRVALLDWLGQIDPHQAGIISERILGTPTDADEWAVCLRNYARSPQGPAGRAFLRSKVEEMIQNAGWRLNPSIGFFESFDVLVHIRATESTGILSKLVEDRSPAGKPLAHAAFLTLDRLTLRETATMMKQLSLRPDLFQERGEMMANLFARADLRDLEQQQLVRSYLLDPARSASELSTFAGVFPNANFTISSNLLSENVTVSHSETHARDVAALQIVNRWLSEPDFSPVKFHLTSIHQRLDTFVGHITE